MNTDLVHFSKFLGRNILCKDKELTLYAVGIGFLLCTNGDLNFIPVSVDECKILCNDRNEYIKFEIPSTLVVLKTDKGEYQNAEGQIQKDEDKKEIDIINAICECIGITPGELKNNYKKRKKELVQARQVHMVIRNLLIRKSESLAQTGAIYNKDHATVLHAKKAVLNALDGYNVEFREKFRKAFELTLYYYPDTAYKKLNLSWL
jgi:hypothetical protein